MSNHTNRNQGVQAPTGLPELAAYEAHWKRLVEDDRISDDHYRKAIAAYPRAVERWRRQHPNEVAS